MSPTAFSSLVDTAEHFLLCSFRLVCRILKGLSTSQTVFFLFLVLLLNMNALGTREAVRHTQTVHAECDDTTMGVFVRN